MMSTPLLILTLKQLTSEQSSQLRKLTEKILGLLTNSLLEGLRPAGAIKEHLVSILTRSREQVAGRRYMNCQ
jgi:hypothetical protein